MDVKSPIMVNPHEQKRRPEQGTGGRLEKRQHALGWAWGASSQRPEFVPPETFISCRGMLR
ncbi:hypothetical protein HYPDE_29288 [Hyphomicrobium denitrificans 1NES1]|uniref:Uncharacterized protein n=1 Tax=Hyphomicrobium denitrificans 1NES1 TaxID=670307 RepID=N0B3J0_9HYPH|nr:hypothetical protein HYPDE_29288 [Hyphomicrobium denitrificans 1NES1]